MKRYDLISGSFWLLVGLGFALGGIYYGFGSLRSPGPGLLPTVFGVVLAALSAGFLVTELKTGREADASPFWKKKGSWRRISFTFFSLVAYMVILKQVGFILTTFLFVFFLLRWVGEKKWMVSILTAAIFSMVCYALFSALLGTPLPKGQIYGSSLRLAPWV